MLVPITPAAPPQLRCHKRTGSNLSLRTRTNGDTLRAGVVRGGLREVPIHITMACITIAAHTAFTWTYIGIAVTRAYIGILGGDPTIL